MKQFLLPALILSTIAVWAAPESTTKSEPVFYQWAKTPPMGWNSYNNFGGSVTEDEVLANATYMKENLLAHGWRYGEKQGQA